MSRQSRVGVIAGTFLLAACTSAGNGAEPAPDDRVASEGSAMVRPGIEVLLTDSLHIVEGLRLGLVTNHTGTDANGIPSIDRLQQHPSIELVALFSPEHGIRGTTEAGVRVDDEVDPTSGLPVHSLYGATRKPTPAMLDGLDVLAFDIQDIGTRYYTYIYTMALAMEAAGEAGIPFVVLDRPNPLGGELVQGNVLEPAFASFVGQYAIPMRHGMTPGELARLFQSEFGVDAQLHVIPMDGWRRGMAFPDTGLPWRPPSPNMPDLESAFHYPGTCLFEGTNFSVGRGTARAFQWVGAPWIDPDVMAHDLNGLGLPGVDFHPARFTPMQPGDGKFDGIEVGGVRLEVTDPTRYDPAVTGVALLVAARRLSNHHWAWQVDHFDRLAGTHRLRLGVEEGRSVEDLVHSWREELNSFEQIRQPALLYP